MSPPTRRSAGLILVRHGAAGLEVFLLHPGGPFWARKDLGAWSIPKGEIEPGEEPFAAACREFREETGLPLDPLGPFRELAPLRQRSGKIVQAWAVEADADPTALRSLTFPLEWPRRSGRMIEVPEADRAAWFGLDEARRRILPGQRPFLDVVESLYAPPPSPPAAPPPD